MLQRPTRLMAVCALIAVGSPAPASEPVPSRIYEMSTETGMPHLEESLRYAVVRERRCLNPRELSSAFWIMGHESMQGCRLDKASEQDDAASYTLVCDGNQGTSGSAQWQLGSQLIRGTLDVRLGGKNMTFYQRITGKAVGECSVP